MNAIKTPFMCYSKVKKNAKEHFDVPHVMSSLIQLKA